MSETMYTNNLIKESSPYLLQHAHNPVEWYPWGEEALQKAKAENKPILVSVGYSACHWCHVMEHETFEDVEAAKFMNEHFVCIKVDREERPDVDQIYMNAIQMINGSGGWPLNCIALPDGRPFYGGTYFPKAQWMDMLSKVLYYIKTKPEQANEQADSLTEGLTAHEQFVLDESKDGLSLDIYNTIISYWQLETDFDWGGHKGAPKFPLPTGYNFLLSAFLKTKNVNAQEIVAVTLDNMADGGIYDQIGGGFARYSTDEEWIVPHFEKMLYDNGQLISLYANAYKLFGEQRYAEVVGETIQFANRELRSAEGAYYSALDADSEGVEGKYYIWSQSEIEEVAGEDAELIKEFYNIRPEGNWEYESNILYIREDKESLSEQFSLSIEELENKIKSFNKRLLTVRENRVKPGLDDKILCSWNALMITGLTDAYKTFGEENYSQYAEAAASFILSKMKQPDGGLFRTYKNGEAKISAYLDDYAYTIQALINLYQISFNETWLYEAKRLTEYVQEHFYSPEKAMFFYTSNKDPELIARKVEYLDNVTPSANAIMAQNVYVLGKYFIDDSYVSLSRSMLNNVSVLLSKGGAYYANWSMLYGWHADSPHEMSIVGENWEDTLKEINKEFIPGVILSGGNNGTIAILKDKQTIDTQALYVCKDKVCQLPVSDLAEVLRIVR